MAIQGVEALLHAFFALSGGRTGRVRGVSMRVTQQVVGYEKMVTFLARTFGVKEPFTIDKANGHLNVVGGWSGTEIGVFPVQNASYEAAMVRPDGRLEFPLREGMFLITDESGAHTVLIDCREEMDGFVVSGIASDAVIQGLGLQVELQQAKAA